MKLEIRKERDSLSLSQTSQQSRSDHTSTKLLTYRGLGKHKLRNTSDDTMRVNERSGSCAKKFCSTIRRKICVHIHPGSANWPVKSNGQQESPQKLVSRKLDALTKPRIATGAGLGGNEVRGKCYSTTNNQFVG